LKHVKFVNSDVLGIRWRRQQIAEHNLTNFQDAEVARVSDTYDMDGHVRLSLGLYAMGALSDESRAQVDSHIECCTICRDVLQELQDVVLMLALALEWSGWP
jgi:hypothetical protein